MNPELYSPKKAQEEASQMKAKIESGETSTYDEAESLVLTEPLRKADELVVSESRKRKLAYTPEFKSGLPRGAIKKFLELIPRSQDVGDISTAEDFTVELIHKITGFSGDAKYYKVSLDKDSYFVKVYPTAEQEFDSKGGGFKEAVGSRDAQQILKERNIDWVEVVDFKLGYYDNNISIFISKWDDRLLFTFSDYLRKLELDSEEQKGLLGKFEELGKVLSGFSDMAGYNMAYDPITKKFILFDLRVSIPIGQQG